jgi:4-amino-4-deoxy-L-arabinose transferase-like glycosyltransferase
LLRAAPFAAVRNRRQISIVIFFFGFAALLIALHLAYLKLPYHWDEIGQFVPAALDIYHQGAFVPKSTVPNVHPPVVMALLALVWKVFGYSIPSARVTMLVVASFGVLFCFLLAIRLARGRAGAPAFAAALFLIASPLFYAQSMLVLLDMPAMVLTLLALLLFLDGRWISCAAACTVLVLVKETALTTPFVFAVWLWFKEGKRSEALYFAAPAVTLAGWLFVLHRATGFWLGNEEFAAYNATGTLEPFHIFFALLRRAWFLFVADGNFIGSIALFVGWATLKGREWRIVFWVAAAQTFVVTVFGGAVLERYLLPVLPLVYIAMATATSAYPKSWRLVSNTGMIAALVAGWFWNPPYPFPLENNLAMVNFVKLQQDAASYLEAYAPNKRILSVWPLTAALSNPDFGYVQKPIQTVIADGQQLTALAGVDRSKYDVLVTFTRDWPVEGHLLDFYPLRGVLDKYFSNNAPASDDQLSAGLGLERVMKWDRAGLSIQVYIHDE